MTEPSPAGPGGQVQDGADTGDPRSGPIVHDRRRVDPLTGEVRRPSGPPPTEAGTSEGVPEGTEGSHGSEDVVAVGEPVVPESELVRAQSLADERLDDLQRLQAEYVNYRRRVERDRAVAREVAVAGVLEAMLPVLDDVHLARRHGDLEGGPFAAIADKLETILSRFGLERFGEPGETFDPTVHEALMHTDAELAEGTTDTTVVQVLQPGYRAGERVIRPARVAVADPG